VTDPIPTKFEEQDKDWIEKLVAQSGLNRSEVIRRSVRVLAIAAKRWPDWNWVGDTAHPIPIHETSEERRGMLAQAMDEAAERMQKRLARKWRKDSSSGKRSA